MQRYLIALTGLALYAGSLGAQDYIDLERERLEEAAAREEQGYQATDTAPATTAPYQESSSQPVDPYQEVPAYEEAPSYPDTTSSGSTAAAPAAGGGQNFGQVYHQLQLLQREVMELRGQVEEQAYELRQLKQQSLERYVDLDRRVAAAGGAPAGNVGQGDTADKGSSPTGGPQQAQAGESDAYRAAYGLVRSKQLEGAVAAFKEFLREYPDGKYAANAHYWLGELYLVITPPDLEASRRAFTLLLEEYPDSPKMPDALYKLGQVYYRKGDSARARQYLDRVVKEYGQSGSSAVNLARDFIAENY